MFQTSTHRQMSFSKHIFLLLALVNVCHAGWFFEPDPTECFSTAMKAGMNQDGEVQTKLWYTLRCRKVNAQIQSCLDAGSDVNAKSNSYSSEGYTALHFGSHYSYSNGKVDVIAALIKAGAVVNTRDNSGQTALHLAASNGNVDVIAALTKAGADKNAKDNDGWTALHQAARYGKVDAIAALIKAGADVNAKDNDGKTYLGGRTSL